MKLFTRYNRINLISTILIFLLASGAFYFLLRYVLIHQLDDDLEIEQREIVTYVDKYDRLPESLPVKDQEIAFLSSEASKEKRKFSTIKVFDTLEQHEEVFRQMTFPISVQGHWYKATVRISLEDTDKITRSIIGITLVTILLILITTFLINRLVLRRLWRPFYETLAELANFRLGKGGRLSLGTGSIDEFNLLNTALEQAMQKADQDYLLLKEFTENASHELQTPLAIIRSKLDLLVQDEQLSEKQSVAVLSANEAIQRLFRLNRSLLLLAKIENLQFSETVQIDLSASIQEKLEQFRELWQSKRLVVKSSLQQQFVQINSELLEVLLNNLLSNATKYNVPDGSINIVLTEGLLLISNTGNAASLPVERLFTRFYKNESSRESNGLGLSIVWQICAVSGWTVRYTFENGRHQFALSWLVNR